MSKNVNRFKIYINLLPELVKQSDIKGFLLEKIQQISNPYYKSRGLYQLAAYYDEKCYELLNESFLLTKEIPEPKLKFQVLEKIYYIVNYKEIEQILFMEQIINELRLTMVNINDAYNQFIASIRLSFYKFGEFRKNYLNHALEILDTMIENDDKIKLIIKLQPIINIYDDLQTKLNHIIETLTNKMNYYFVHNYYGRILSTENFNVHFLEPRSDTDLNQEDEYFKREITNISNYDELHSLFLLFAHLNDTKLLVIKKDENRDQPWINLFKDTNNLSYMDKIIDIGLHDEIFLTPHIAIIIDELIEKGMENMISILFPYIIKPANEVLPIVQKWFSQNDHSPIKNLAAILLSETKHIFAPFVDIIVRLLTSDNDQIRYRCQRIFQHPDRDVQEPNKRVSVIGEKTLLKIFESYVKNENISKFSAFLNTFFCDLLWHDAAVFNILYEHINRLEDINSSNGRRMKAFGRIHFIETPTWNSIMNTLGLSEQPFYIKELIHSVMIVTQTNQITDENWIEFARILSIKNTKFLEKIFFNLTYTERVNIIIDHILLSTHIQDETF